MREPPGDALGGRRELQHGGQLPGQPRHPGDPSGPFGHLDGQVHLAQGAGRGRGPQMLRRVLQFPGARQRPRSTPRARGVAVQCQADPGDRVPQEPLGVRRGPAAELDDGRGVPDMGGRLHGVGQHVQAVARRQDPHGLGDVPGIQFEPAPEPGDLQGEAGVVAARSARSASSVSARPGRPPSQAATAASFSRTARARR
ncbi:hypothetical protein, partial [Actinomadura sp. CNU-125]|uniref:hypothetical protein n=1 Tax=Actinomadura sp. CNU-125 TaxID=1904961 RepID=UPI0021CCD776